MKQIIIFFLLLVLEHFQADSQGTFPVRLETMPGGLTTIYNGSPTPNAAVLAIGISDANSAYTSARKAGESISQKLILGQKHAENLTIGEVFDTAGVHIFIFGTNAWPVGQYEFRVLKNAATVILPWKTVSEMYNEQGLVSAKSYLGNFKVDRGNFLVVDLRRKGADSALSTAVVFFQKTQPTLARIYLADQMKQFTKELTSPNWEPDSVERTKWQAHYTLDEVDSASGLPKKLELTPHQNTVIFYLKERVNKAELLEYQLLRDGEVFTNWKTNDFDNGFVWLNNLPPGRYELKMRFTIQKENVTTYQFEIKPRWDQTVYFKLVAGGLIAAFFGFLLLLYRLRRQRQKFRWTKVQKDKAETELRSIYAQLNPHFVFNALSSIQGLVNKGETEKANHYLSTFSKLLRDSLVNNEKDSLPLSTELQTLETYLQLEQLRFHFQYMINIDNSINPDSVEVPSLLLQPLVENAIKHGVCPLHEKGNVAIYFIRHGNDMVCTITDNGNGFDPALETKGFGWKLTRERIRLLNETNKEQVVDLTIESCREKGTTVLVRFKNWL